jgi:hypothetical protein
VPGRLADNVLLASTSKRAAGAAQMAGVHTAHSTYYCY